MLSLSNALYRQSYFEAIKKYYSSHTCHQPSAAGLIYRLSQEMNLSSQLPSTSPMTLGKTLMGRRQFILAEPPHG